MIKLLKKLYYLLSKNLDNSYYEKSYSQEGEDMVLNRIFEGQEKGFYIDIGAHHPKRFSNTYYFYKKGWRGINIDAMPGSMKSFNKVRPKDMNLEVGISSKEGILEYYIYNEPALNTFNGNLYKDLVDKGTYKLLGTKKVEVKTLKSLLDTHNINNKIDFISIDAEGYDFEVLRSNDWNKYRPTFILVECLLFDLDNLQKDDIYKYMSDEGYSFICKTVNTCIFKDSKF
jgi:FkbM family methyltransferase